MTYSLPKLPYSLDALEPYISEETLKYHYGKHHKAYCDKLNKLISGTHFEARPLEYIINNSSGSLFNNAAQFWNHNFYWASLSPKHTMPSGKLQRAINKYFGSLEDFKEEFSNSASRLFGSGWTWLVRGKDGTLAIRNTADAHNPVEDLKKPLLTCDVWEHAYYIDYRNSRMKYIDAFWKLANWDFASKNFHGK